MSEKEEKKMNKYVLWSLVAAIVLLVVGGVVLTGNILITRAAEDVFLKGTKVSNIDIGGLSEQEAFSKIEKQIDFISQKGFVYTSAFENLTVYPNVAGIEDTDTSYPLIIWNTSDTLSEIRSIQSRSELSDFWDKLQTITKGKNYQILYDWDQEQHLSILMDALHEYLQAKQEASFEFTDNGLEITESQVGQSFDYQRAMNDTQSQIANLSNRDIEVMVINDQPLITQNIIKMHEQELINLSNRGDFYITYNENDWNIPNRTWKNWLGLKVENGRTRIVLDEEKFKTYLFTNGILQQIEQPVQDAKFNLEDGRVTEFANSQNGVKINYEQTMKELNETLFRSGELEVAIVTDIVEPKISNESVNDLGIVALLGTGESDFSGSPPNRIHNITVGADTLNGILIAPGEEFSLIEALGEIDGEHGYLQELVIKGNETIPEYGGGLCQIGTTTFRAALQSGMNITARRNHSYRVRYYEPAGTDATIYDPAPDFKFINDTQHHILIQTRIEGAKLYFDFWGTPDGRKVTVGDPTIYNIVAPPPRKEILTTDLAPGQIRCTESAHNGADAKFDYTVERANGELHEETFYSHYVPWQEVCLVGATQEEIDAQNASSTEDGIEE